MNERQNKGITLITLSITIVILIIISGISITGAIMGKNETEDSALLSELNMIQHAVLERHIKAQLTKEELPGTKIEKSEVQKIIDEINTKSTESIQLKGTEYKELSISDLESLGIMQEDNKFIVNYETGEVINTTLKVTSSGKALYIYSKNEN